MVGVEIDDDAGFDELHKPTFFALCTVYSGVDSLLNHPFAVSTAVAELHKSDGTVRPPSNSPPRRIRGYGQFYTKFSTANNLSVNQALRDIMAHSCPPQAGPASTIGDLIRKTRCVYTGFPANFLGLLSGDLCQMVLYSAVKTHLDHAATAAGPDHPVWSKVPIPAVSGFIAMSFCAVPCNAAIVVFRHQVRQRLAGNDHSMFNVLTRVIPAMEGGITRVLLRGTLVSSPLNIFSASLGWEAYETSRKFLIDKTGSHSLTISLISGSWAGAIDVLLTRPLSVIMSRFQTNQRKQGFFSCAKQIIAEEGYGALYKGFTSQMLSNVPRMAVFYGFYSTFVTWAKQASSNRNDD
jgi:hypothetical protein